MKERIFTTKEQGRALVEAGLPISTASGFRDRCLDRLHSMEDEAGRIGLIEAVTPDISNPVWAVGTYKKIKRILRCNYVTRRQRVLVEPGTDFRINVYNFVLM